VLAIPLKHTIHIQCLIYCDKKLWRAVEVTALRTIKFDDTSDLGPKRLVDEVDIASEKVRMR
jgi:hypothetical protein